MYIYIYNHCISSRIIVLLKTPDQQLLHVDFISVQNGFCRPFLIRAAKMFSDRFIAEALLDHIRYSTAGI